MPKRVDFSRMQFSTLLVVGETLKGSIKSRDNICIQGRFHGSISTRGFVRVDEGAEMVGDIEAREAQILGKVKGNLRIAKMLDLGPAGKIEGNYTTRMMWAPLGYQVPQGSTVQKKNFPMFY